MKIQAIVQSTRPPFLILTPVCVLLGVSTVIYQQVSVDWYLFTLALLGGLLAHISVNTLNEYLDFSSGLDLATEKTPFSGGSGALPASPNSAKAVLQTGITSLLFTIFIGLYFVWLHGFDILPLGLLGVFLILAYTSWINKYALICLISPGLGFGLLMVAGTHFAVTGYYDYLSWLSGLIPFFLVNNLLLLNQFPDIEADKKFGRNHLSIQFGIKISVWVYGIFALLTLVSIILAVINNHFPQLSLLALLPMPLAVYALSGMLKHGQDIGKFPQFLSANVLLSLIVPTLLAVSFLLA